MLPEKKECKHIIKVLHDTKIFLKSKDTIKLKELSDKTIHSTCNYQDSESITIAVIIYTLSKLIERQDYKKIKNWDIFVKKFTALLDLAAKAIQDENQKAYHTYIHKARNLLGSYSVNLKPYIRDVLKKASINKGSKIYEHGISLEQTAKLFGITQWELSDYIGQKTSDIKQNRTIDIKERIKLALEFFR